MDLWQLIFPFLMAVIASSVMIVIIYFLRKIPYFANLFSVWFMLILYLIGVLRIFLPVEFPGVQIVLRDSVILNPFIESMIRRESLATGSPSVLMYVILAIWAVGVIVFAVGYFTVQVSFRKYILSNADSATDEERALLKTVASEIIEKDTRILLRKTDAVDRIMVIGLFRPCVLLPDCDYDPDRLGIIFRHECTHISNKDLWLKFLIQIYCCVFWWNPFSYLLKHDLDFTLEMKCDLSVTKDLSPEKTLLYLDTIRYGGTADNMPHSRKNPFLVCAELSDSRKNNNLVKRVKAITAAPPNRIGQVIVNIFVSLVLVSIFAVSYVFIWQPFYGFDTTDENYDLIGDEIVVDESNGYLVLQEDGSYSLYFGEVFLEQVSKEEVEKGLYREYPILE